MRNAKANPEKSRNCIRRFLKRAHWWPIICTLALTAFAASVVLDAFFIPKAIRTMPDVSYAQSDNATEETVTDVDQTTSAMAEAHDAIFAINGDYYGYRSSGFVVRNGVLYRSSTSGRHTLVVYGDGSFEVVSESTASAKALVEQGAVQIFSFGPSLVLNGEVSVAADKTKNPRTAIGIISPLHNVMIVADGRTGASSGLTPYQLDTIFQDLGCETAYNLDGGGSSTMWFNGEVVNAPTDGRSVG